MKRLLIFDSYNYIFRAFYASPPMTNSVHFPTNALHFYTTMILSVIRRIAPDAVLLASDAPGKKFRHELYPDYKGNREPPPEALVQQFPYFRPIADALGLRTVEAQGFEADDVIASLTQKARQKNWSVVIASSDKDLMQLVEPDDAVILLDALAKGKDYRVIRMDDVITRFNVGPEGVADVLALAGDSIDNIPGCKGIGEKTAGKLIKQYGSLSELMNRRSEIKRPAQKANLDAFAPNADLSRRLTALVRDVPVEFDEQSRLNPDPQKLTQLFSALDLRKLLNEILGPNAAIDPAVPKASAAPCHDAAPASSVPEPPQDKTSQKTEPSVPAAARFETLAPPQQIRPFMPAHQVRTAEEVRVFADAAANKCLAVVPVLQQTRLIGAAMASSTDAIYIPIRHNRSLFGAAASVDDLEAAFQNLLASNTLKAVFGIKPVLKYAWTHGISIDLKSFFDTEIAAYAVSPEPQTIAGCAAKYLGVVLDKTPENWLGSGKKMIAPESMGAGDAAIIVGKWAQCVLQLAEKLPAELDAHQLRIPFDAIDMPLSAILARMEFDGIGVNIETLHALSASFDEDAREIESKIFAFAQAPFNINSTRELAHFLFDELKVVPAAKKKRQGGLSTDQDTLESIDHPVAQLVSEYRTLNKLRSTYADALAKLADPKTHRIHARFNGCVTATTRLSSSDPNLQNIPSRAEIGRKIKRAFIPQDGWSFVSADYSQIELRLMAAMSGEPVLCDAYRRGEDVHARTAAALFDVQIENVSKEQRQLAKTINFGLLYGMGVQKLARETGYPKAEAKVFLEKFHAQFPTLTAFFASQVENARSNGETRTMMGHRRPMPELFSTHALERAAGERIALNAPVQGSASDIVKCAMIRLCDEMHRRCLHGRLLIQVHDELLLECPDDEVQQTAELLVEVMENAADIGVPLRAELKIGKNWADMH